MKLSIVTTLYYSAPYLEEFYTRMRAAAIKITPDYEIVLVNDGTPDQALEMSLALRQRDARVVVVDLSRNFGHHKAMMLGLSYAQGDLVYLTDCDLEEEPELLGQFYDIMGKSKAEVVFGVQQLRKGDWLERVSGRLFWTLYNKLSSYPTTPNQLVSRLMVRDYVIHLLRHEEQAIFMPGLWAITGFRQIPVAVTKHAKGSSTYTVGKKAAQFVDAITSFSAKPLALIFYLGALIVLLALVAAAFLAVRGVSDGLNQPALSWLLVSVWMLGGLTLTSVGIVGVYLGRVFAEVKPRPTIVRAVYQGNATQDVMPAARLLRTEKVDEVDEVDDDESEKANHLLMQSLA